MVKYIDADKLINHFNALSVYDGITLIRAIQEQPAADVAPVKHGRWKVLASGNDAICTNCEHYWIPNGDQYDYHYCPNCGAKMDKEDSSNE